MKADRPTLEALRDMISSLHPGGIGNDGGDSFKAWGFGADGVHVKRTHAKAYEDAARLAHNKSFQNDYSFNEFEKRIVGTLGKRVITNDIPTDDEIQKFLEALHQEKVLQFLVTRDLKGAELSNNTAPLSLGPFKIYHYKSHKSCIHSVSNEYPPIREEDVGYLIGVVVEAKSKDRAIEKADIHFEVFERLVRFMVGPSETYDVAIFGAHGWYSQNAYVFCDGAPVSQEFSWKGSMSPLALDNKYFNSSDHGTQLLWNAVNNSNAPQLHQRLANAARWLGDSYSERDRAASFIKAAIALEVLFTANEKSIINPSILQSISECVACILGQDLEGRLAIEKKMKAFYSTRSAIAHSGKNNVSQTEVDEFVQIVRAAIGKVLTTPVLRDQGSIEKLHEHLKHLKYSFPPIA